MNINKTLTAVALPLIAMSSMLPAARANKNANCAPTPPVTCYPDDCQPCYCLGPENYGVNAAVRPRTCNGDFVVTIAGFYWNAHQDGMEYAVKTEVSDAVTERSNLIDAHYLNPDFEWNFGFKIGLGYNTTCDGWDVGILWTRYKGKANSHVETEPDDNAVLLPLWSNFTIIGNPIPFATDIETHWSVDLNLIDIELGREFWNSKMLTIRPFVGLRIAYIEQEYDIMHKGGIWSLVLNDTLNNTIKMDNNFKGVGLRAGLDTVWNFGCGWALYGNTAISIIYGRFHLDQDESNRQAIVPFDKTKILETKDSFRASRLVTDLALGIQYSQMFCQCKYGITVQLGWEQHLFLDQNQLWRVKRSNIGPIGENIFVQTRGDLDTQGWTLSFRFEF